MNTNLEIAKHYFELGLNLLEQKDFLGAEENFLRALSYAPDRLSILINLSATLLELGKWSECEKICQRALIVDHKNYEALLNLGTCFSHQDKHVEAGECLDKAISINPNSDQAWTNKGNLYLELGQITQAETCFEKAISINALSHTALIGRGNLHNERKEYQLALDDFDAAIKLNPSNAQAKWNKSLSLLRLGNFLEGWKLYESRWEILGMREHQKHLNIPLWLGQESIKNKTILIYAEQGYGDTIQFCRYLPLLEKLGATVIFEAQKSLIDLMKTLSPRIHVLEKNALVTYQHPPQIDFQCPIISLPLAFGTKLETIPNSTPYLFVNKCMLEVWRNKLDESTKSKSFDFKPYRVGITWSGSGHYAGRKNAKRNMAIEQIASLINKFCKKEIEFHSLQIEPQKNMALKDLAGDNFFIHDSALQTFLDTASLMSQMDLIVSIDTANAHLAGALNIPTFLLIPDPPDFMALCNRADSPWYPSTKLIRQHEPGIWPIDDITLSIKRLMKKNHLRRGGFSKAFLISSGG